MPSDETKTAFYVEFERILDGLLMLLNTTDELVLQYLTAVKSSGTVVGLNGADVSQSDTSIYSKDKVTSQESSDCCSAYDPKEARLRMTQHNEIPEPMRHDKIIDTSRNPRCC